MIPSPFGDPQAQQRAPELRAWWSSHPVPCDLALLENEPAPPPPHAKRGSRSRADE
jgi:hypothetical protein